MKYQNEIDQIDQYFSMRISTNGFTICNRKSIDFTVTLLFARGILLLLTI